MSKQGARNRETAIVELQLVKKPVQRVQGLGGLRDGSTGQIVFVPAERLRPVLLPRVYAVGEEVAAEPEVTAGEGVSAEVMPAAAAPATEGVAFYRKYTEAMLRRYLRLSMSAGRVPSLLGREMFRGQVTSYRMHNFEDVVIFCHDIERILDRLKPVHQELIRRVAMQQYSHGEAAGAMGLSLTHLKRLYNEALDRLTERLLQGKLLDRQKCCQ